MKPVARELPSGTVTFLFTDVEGSTKLLHELGADAYAWALREHRRLLRGAFAAHSGVEVDTQGDAFFVAFSGAPDAVAAAQRAQEALASGPVRVRIGLHTGRPKLAEEGYVGADVHLGARIAGAGHGGQVLLSRATRELVESEISDLGEHRLKDFAEPVWLFQLGSERFPPLKTISNTNLPRPASSFLGREREVEELAALIRDGVRLVTLTGAGGSGKTRLAIEAAAELVPEFPNGAFWVGFAALRDPGLVLDTIAQTLGAKGGLAEHIGERELLLLLDNLEQVIEASPELASLLEECPHLHLLVTSRELLRVRGEVEYAVPPLGDREAVELFCERARTQADATITELCRRLDHLPLAVELAAARASVLQPSQILERLSKRLDLLKGGRDASPRQQTLRATIEWSHDLLTEEEKSLFARLAVFAGGCTLAGGEEVVEADLDTLQSLVEKSLLRHTNDRFWMLETIREYAAERLEASKDAGEVRRRHAEHFLGFAQQARPFARGPEEKRWLDRLLLELDNFRAAFAYALESEDAALGLTTAEALEPLWIRGMRQREAVRWLEPMLALDGEVDAPVRGGALTLAGRSAVEVGELEQAEPWLRAGLELVRESGDELRTAWALHGFGHLLAEQGDSKAAQSLFEESADLFLRLGEHSPAGGRLTFLAYYAAREGDLDKAESLLKQATEQYRLAGDLTGIGGCIQGLGDLALERGDVQAALERYREAQPLVIQGGSSLDIEYALAGVAAVAALVGRSDVAARLWGAVERMDSQADRRMEADDRARYERALGALDETELEAGRALSDEAALEIARAIAAELVV
jgi:predicted ATPase/class 3 adenylate cyclase